MAKKLLLFLMGMVIVLGCSGQNNEVVSWKPKHPRAGQSITVTFRPRRLLNAEPRQSQIFLVCQLFEQKQTNRVFKTSMKRVKQGWKARIETSPETYLIRLKFEDQMSRVEDNNGRGWKILVRDRAGKVARNTHRTLGMFYLQKQGPAVFVDSDSAIYEFKQELKLFPDNYDAWFDLWRVRLEQAKWSSLQQKRVEQQLDSLLKDSPPNPELLALAFRSYRELLKDPAKALHYGQQFLSSYPDHPRSEAIKYAMIFLQNRENQGDVINALIRFTQQTGDTTYLKTAYYQLGVWFQNVQDINKSVEYFKKYVELVPDDISTRLNLARLYVRKKDYEMAQQMIDSAAANNRDEIYLQTHVWQPPEVRAKQLNLNQCEIFSTRALLETARGKFQEAIQYRRQAIALHSPFPAFEWVKIGDLYFQAGQMDSARQAYVKAVSLNSVQEDAIQKLKFFYLLKHKSKAGFDKYLQQAISEELKSSAKPAPDFELTDLAGNTQRLSDQQGKVVVLTFWDSWSSACQREIPELNKLVNAFRDNPKVLCWAISVEAPVSIRQ